MAPPTKRTGQKGNGSSRENHARPGSVRLAHGSFVANAVPDVFDGRDLEYRPRLQPLPREIEFRPKDHYVMSQKGSSCTGHAVAAMINAVQFSQGDATHVSPYMLYALARRYDEFPGEADEGSSLRGALKGWYYHGVLPSGDWPNLAMDPEPDIDSDDAVSAKAAQRPLGAFYRVNAARLDDLQSAINELSAIVVSASIHEGWTEPVVMKRGDHQMHVITRTSTTKAVGGHAFCIVGYNEVGFLVQNSWGVKWGSKGFATLPYDDWLDSGYDAWVARPGVPSVVSERTRRRVLAIQGGGLVEAPGPDLRELANHVVNLGNDGRLSTNGRFKSSKAQVDKIFAHMAETHDAWGDQRPRRIVVYAHGGLDSEKTALTIAQRQTNWWLTNQVYPLFFAWQTGAAETLQDELSDLVHGRLPSGAGLFGLVEALDRAVEQTVKTRLRWAWAEMKENAERASDPLPADVAGTPDQDVPGATLAVARLEDYLATRPAEVHLVGHSAGSIFLMPVVDALGRAGIPVASLTYLAAALRTDAWVSRVLPHLRNGGVGAFTAFGLNPVLELDDVCAAGGIDIYHKSLLYLVSRAFEKPTTSSEKEVPLVGMAHFAEQQVGGTSLAAAVEAARGELIWSTRDTPARSRTQATSHGGFDDDSATMTSVLLRILGQDQVRTGNKYVPNLPPPEIVPLVVSDPTALEDQAPELVAVEAHGDGARGPAGARPGRRTTTRSAALRGSRRGRDTSANPVLAAMVRDGWTKDHH